MHYVISDIHGCYEKFIKLLNEINFSESDILYVLGDVVDRGPKPMEVFQEIMKRNNVVFIQGNHERMFEYFVSEMGLDMSLTKCTEDMRLTYLLWIREGGVSTDEGFYNLPIEEKQAIIKYIEDAPVYEEVDVNGKHYVLAHAGIQNYDSSKKLYEYNDVDFLEGRTDYSRPLFDNLDYILVTGHTPTFYFRPDGKPEIYINNGHIAVDCGAIYGGRLAAYCFETEEAFYV